MFELADDARLQIKQFVGQCAACSFNLKGNPAQSMPPCTQGILAEKLGMFATFAVDGQDVYATGILLPGGPLCQSIDMIYQKASAALQHVEGRVVTSNLKIISSPEPCQTPKDIDLDRHGIILFSRGRSHYLLPRIALSQGLSRTGALEYLCRCLALPAGTWRDRTARIMTFETVDL